MRTQTLPEKKIPLAQHSYFPVTTIPQNTSCICSFFAHTTVLKAVPGFQYILNISMLLAVQMQMQGGLGLRM